MSIESEIIAVIESRGGCADRLTIMATLHAYSQGSVEVMLSGMTKRGAIVRVSKGVYELPKSSDAAPAPKPEHCTAAWLADGLAPYQRVRLFIEANGPPKKQALLKMLAPFVDGAVRVLGAMVVEHAVHQTDDGRIALGRNPKMPTVRKHVDPRIEPRLPPAKLHPEEAVEPREASADATSEKPASTRVDVCAGDAPDESAEGTNPAAEIGPPLAPHPLIRDVHRAAAPLFAPKYEPHPDDANKAAHIVIETKGSNPAPRSMYPWTVEEWNRSWNPKQLFDGYTAKVTCWECRPVPGSALLLVRTLSEIAREEAIDRATEESQQEDDMSEIQDTAPPVGANAQTPGTTPVATFHVELPGLHIAISGEAKAVMQAVAAIEKTFA